MSGRPGKPRRLAMARVNVQDVRCEALFASRLRRSAAPTAEAVAEAISRTVRQFGIRGCASRMAQEFGDHPEAAADRLRGGGGAPRRSGVRLARPAADRPGG